MKYRPIFLIVSLLLLGVSLFSILTWGFNLSQDFVGGSEWELQSSSNLDRTKIEEAFKKQDVELEGYTQNSSSFTLKFANVSQDKKTAIESSLKSIDSGIKELRYETVGPVLGRELVQKTIVAVILSSLALLLFIGSKFKDFSFGTSAILAMLHDAFILIGAFSLLGHFFGAKLDALFVTALLTTLSASVHDTVVTFDRIRELKRKNFKQDWVSLANQAVSEVIVRSINNSMTIIFMLLSLVILGGEVTRWFAMALLIGVVCGTYSSTGVAIPLVLFWKNRKAVK